MNIAILTGNFIKNKSANSNCIENIFHEWEKDGDTVHVICPNESEQFLEKSRHEMVHGFSNFHKKNWIECTRLKEKTEYIFHRLKDYFRYPRVDCNMVDRYFQQIEKVCSGQNIDLIVSVCNPPETVEAAYKFLLNRKQIKWIIYDIDTISNCSHGSIDKLIKGIIRYKALKWETMMFARADLIVHLPQHSKHFNEQSYKAFTNKMIIQELPLLRINLSEIHDDDNNRAQMIYAGRFYPGMRDPNLILPLLLEALDTLDMKLQVYTDDGYCKKISEKYHENESLSVSNYIPEEELRIVIEKSSFLISLGNKGTEMFPSKIVTYVGSCKPIIHFYQDGSDPVIGYLSAYPDKLLVDLNGRHGEIIDALRMYVSVKHEPINSDEILSIFEANTPKKNSMEMKAYLNI